MCPRPSAARPWPRRSSPDSDPCPVSALTIRFNGPSPLGRSPASGLGLSAPIGPRSRSNGRGLAPSGASSPSSVTLPISSASWSWISLLLPTWAAERHVVMPHLKGDVSSRVGRSGSLIHLDGAANTEGADRIRRPQRAKSYRVRWTCSTVSSMPTGMAPRMLPIRADRIADGTELELHVLAGLRSRGYTRPRSTPAVSRPGAPGPVREHRPAPAA